MAVDVEREQAAGCLVVDRHVIQFQGKVGIIDYPAIEGGFGAYLNLVSLIGTTCVNVEIFPFQIVVSVSGSTQVCESKHVQVGRSSDDEVKVMPTP